VQRELGFSGATLFALDDDYIYFYDGSTQAIRKASRDIQTDPEPAISNVSMPAMIVADGGEVFWIDKASKAIMVGDAGAPRELVSSAGANSIDVDANGVYWSSAESDQILKYAR